MRPLAAVDEVFRLHELGLSKLAIARETGVSRAQVRTWLAAGRTAVRESPTRRWEHASDACTVRDAMPPPAYAYLLGQYLGDGCLSPTGQAWRLRIAACDDYPGIRDEIVDAVEAVMPGHRAGSAPKVGCTEIYSTSKHWLCLFPQHGPGRKHERPIELERWQRTIALDGYSAALVRGPIHSDGCRAVNRVQGGRYAYTRYFLTNESTDILRIFEEACDRIGVEHRRNRSNSVSIARRASVARLEELVGPKF